MSENTKNEENTTNAFQNLGDKAYTDVIKKHIEEDQENTKEYLSKLTNLINKMNKIIDNAKEKHGYSDTVLLDRNTFKSLIESLEQVTEKNKDVLGTFERNFNFMEEIFGYYQESMKTLSMQKEQIAKRGKEQTPELEKLLENQSNIVNSLLEIIKNFQNYFPNFVESANNEQTRELKEYIDDTLLERTLEVQDSLNKIHMKLSVNVKSELDRLKKGQEEGTKALSEKIDLSRRDIIDKSLIMEEATRRDIKTIENHTKSILANVAGYRY